MGDSAKPDELAVRLHLLRAREGLTIQQMAARCSIPKSSLESYMRAVDAKRPGVDALVAIANGMGVSIDWIVGRTGNSRDQRLEDRDYALACFSIVKAMLEHLQSLQRERPAQPIIDDRQVGGLEVSEAAALAMSQFLERIQHYREFSIYMGERHDLQEAVAAEYSRRARLAEE